MLNTYIEIFQKTSSLFVAIFVNIYLITFLRIASLSYHKYSRKIYSKLYFIV